MSNPLNALRKTAAIAALILFGVSGAAANAVAGATPETYTWSAKLVAYDEVEKMATVQAMVVGDGERTGYTAGDRESDAVAGEVEIPRDFAGIVGRYLVFPAPVPTDYLRTIRMFDPGHWDTAEGLQPAGPPSHDLR